MILCEILISKDQDIVKKQIEKLIHMDFNFLQKLFLWLSYRYDLSQLYEDISMKNTEMFEKLEK
jgi:hypothetical protein